MTLIEKIKGFMKTNNLNVSDFVKLVGVPYTTTNSLFTCDCANPKKDTLIKLKNAMGLTLDELADDSVVVDFENIKNKKIINGDVDVAENTVIAIGRGGKRSVYNLDEADIKLVDLFLNRLNTKS